MRFVDLLRATVVLSAGAATTLGVLCLAGAASDADQTIVLEAVGWWIAASVIGSIIGRRASASPPIARVLAEARAATMMPDHRPGAAILNRLWPLLAGTVIAGALAVVAPQIPGIAAGFAIIWALSWRQQDRAVLAIEERDGVTFFLERTSPLRPVKLVRMPGFRREVPTVDGVPPV